MVRRYFTTFTLFCLLLSTSALAQNPANSAAVPLKQGLDALAKAEFADADRWFVTTAHDFPTQLDGLRAVALQLTYRVASELANLKMAKQVAAGGATVLEGRKRWQLLEKEYQEAARSWGEKTRNLVAEFMKNDANLPLKLTVSVKLDGLEVAKFRERLQKGEFLDESERAQLYQGELISNFVGFLSELLEVPDSQLMEGAYQGELNRPVFYRGIGARLFILGEESKKTEDFEAARRCFEKVLALTESTPYQADRQRAKDFLARLAIKPNEKKSH